MRFSPSPNQLNKAAFFPENIYHVFSRTNNKEDLFRDSKDRSYFLALYKKFVVPYVNTFAYCLLDNHFHIMLQVKCLEEIQAAFELLPKSELTRPQVYWLNHLNEPKNVHQVLERQFTRLFSVYAIAFNRKYKRRGNLFYRPFKRVQVTTEQHMLHLVWYIHHNPEKHGICNDFTTYPWSSYKALVSKHPTLLCRSEVHQMFDDIDQFLAYHQQNNLELPEDWDESLEVPWL